MESRGAVVFFNREKPEFLVVQHDYKDRYWGFPKGSVENGETDEETALREIFEETGLRVSLVEGFKEAINYRLWGKHDKRAVFFLAESKSKEVKPQKGEISNFEWLGFEEALEKLTFKKTSEVLEKAHAFLRENF